MVLPRRGTPGPWQEAGSFPTRFPQKSSIVISSITRFSTDEAGDNLSLEPAVLCSHWLTGGSDREGGAACLLGFSTRKRKSQSEGTTRLKFSGFESSPPQRFNSYA